jgi:hypothetical protein
VKRWQAGLDLHNPGVSFERWAAPFDARPAPDLSDVLAFCDPERPWLLSLREPLLTKAPSPARCSPFCCYARTVIFYHRPYVTVQGPPSRWRDGTLHRGSAMFVEFDRIETRLNREDVIRFDGARFVIGGGSIRWHHKRWWVHLDARRQAEVVDFRRSAAA